MTSTTWQDAARVMFTSWLADGSSWVGVFQNQDLGHPDAGRKIALCYDDSQFYGMGVGQARAPDHADIGLGWRYRLIAKCRTVEEAMDAMDENVPQSATPQESTR